MTYSAPTSSSLPTTAYLAPARRRGARRRSLNAPVKVLSPYQGDGVTINASRGGLRVAVDCVLACDDICRLRVDDPDGPPQLVRGRVVWSQQVGDGCIAGLALLLRN